MWKNLYKMSVSVALAAVAFAPTAALAQLPPLPTLPGGPPPFAVRPPPILGAGGPPLALRVGGQAIHPGPVAVSPRADVAGPHGPSSIGGPTGVPAGNRGATFGYSHSRSFGYANRGWRYAHTRDYSVYGRGNDDYADDGCYYVYSRNKRDLVCD
jgi:hypothetical protein